MHAITLTSGQEMPLLGLGTWDLRGSQCEEIVHAALEMGYRHIDTAWMYDNQREVGEGIRASDVAYDEVFLTSKIWKSHLKRDQVRSQHGENIAQLGFDYVDLLLIHWPSESGVPLGETLAAFAELQEENATRAVGVSNFSPGLVDNALETSRVAIVNNQFQYSLQRHDEKLRQHCQGQGVAVTAYSPLAKGSMAEAEAVAIARRTTRKVAGLGRAAVAGAEGCRRHSQIRLSRPPRGEPRSVCVGTERGGDARSGRHRMI